MRSLWMPPKTFLEKPSSMVRFGSGMAFRTRSGKLVAFWHKADMRTVLSDVCFRG